MYAVVGATGNTGRAVVKELKGWARTRCASSAMPTRRKRCSARTPRPRWRSSTIAPAWKRRSRAQARVHRHRPQPEIGRAADQRDRCREGRGRGIHRQGVGRPRRDRSERRVGQRPRALSRSRSISRRAGCNGASSARGCSCRTFWGRRPTSRTTARSSSRGPRICRWR